MKVCDKDIIVDGRLIRIARPELDSYESLQHPDVIVDGLRKSSVRVDLFTFMQVVAEPSPKYDYVMEWDNLAAVPVTTFDSWWTRQINNKTRNMVRRAEKKGVQVREVPFDEALVKGITAVYNESRVRQGRPFTHYGLDIQTVRQLEATFLDRSIFIGAFQDDELIGFMKMVTDEDGTQANLMNILSMMKHRDKSPTNALMAAAVRACAERGIRHLLYQNLNYGNKADSLTAFKEANGFQRVEVPRYYVPLTLVGRAALRLRLHHRFVDRLPDRITAKFRHLRHTWYNRNLPSETQGA